MLICTLSTISSDGLVASRGYSLREGGLDSSTRTYHLVKALSANPPQKCIIPGSDKFMQSLKDFPDTNTRVWQSGQLNSAYCSAFFVGWPLTKVGIAGEDRNLASQETSHQNAFGSGMNKDTSLPAPKQE